MGLIKKGVKCSVKGCDAPAVRSMKPEKIGRALEEAGLDVVVVKKRVFLCEKHYKLVRKFMKKSGNLDRLRW